MSKIPEDIQTEAWRVYRSLETAWMKAMMEDHTWDDVAKIANAILAERQRCADIAKRVWRDADFHGDEDVRKAASLIRCRIDTGAAT